MKSLNHSKVYYKGLGQVTEEDCTRYLHKWMSFLVVSCVLMFFYVMVYCVVFDTSIYDNVDCIFLGFGGGLLFSIILDVCPRIQMYQLRLKEIKEGEE